MAPFALYFNTLQFRQSLTFSYSKPNLYCLYQPRPSNNIVTFISIPRKQTATTRYSFLNSLSETVTWFAKTAPFSFRDCRGSLETKATISGSSCTVTETVEKKMRKRKKDRDSPQVKLKNALDMCSKRGDVMGALSLYDSAISEGVKLGQHHYTVLLYLCSSAAVGVLRPAKSGSGARTLNALVSSDGVLNEGFSGPMDTKDSSFELDCNAGSSSDLNSSEKDGVFLVSEEVKRYALQRGFEVYENMRVGKVEMNEAALTAVARMAMSVGDGDMAFEMVRQMKGLGISPKLRSYGPALSTFCNNGEVEKAFAVEKHMLEHGVYPEEPELEALLRVSIGAGNGDKVYYVLHKIRSSVRKVSQATACLIVDWFENKQASRVGKRKWDKRLIREAIENNGGGWHGQGWLGKGKWEVAHTTIGKDGKCKCCGVQLTTIDLDPVETENFAKSVASIAMMREKGSNFQKFQVRNYYNVYLI